MLDVMLPEHHNHAMDYFRDFCILSEMFLPIICSYWWYNNSFFLIRIYYLICIIRIWISQQLILSFKSNDQIINIPTFTAESQP